MAHGNNAAGAATQKAVDGTEVRIEHVRFSHGHRSTAGLVCRRVLLRLFIPRVADRDPSAAQAGTSRPQLSLWSACCGGPERPALVVLEHVDSSL